jgi:hypothetical protein
MIAAVLISDAKNTNTTLDMTLSTQRLGEGIEADGAAGDAVLEVTEQESADGAADGVVVESEVDAENEQNIRGRCSERQRRKQGRLQEQPNAGGKR